MSANFTPSLNSYTDLTPFRFWCQKILPLVYEDSLSYYELLCKVIDYLNKTMEDVNLSIEDVEKLHTAYESLQGYVNDYFDNLDVQEEINNKLDALVEDGTIHDIFNPDVEAILNVANQAASDAIEAIPQNVTNWLNEHVNPESDVVIDDTLSIQGAAADAKKTGDEISALKSDLTKLSNDVGVTHVSYTSVSGEYINKNGAVAQSDPFSHTNPFAVSKGDLVVVKATGYETKVAMIATCNVDLSNISVKVASTDGTNRKYTYLCESDGYVVVSYYTAGGCKIALKSAKSNDMLDARLNAVETADGVQNALVYDSRISVLADNVTGTVGQSSKYINKNGGVTNSNNFYITNPITMYKGQTIRFNCKGYLTEVAMLASVEDGVYTPLIVSSDNDEHILTYTCMVDMNVVISCNVTVTAKYSIYASQIGLNNARITALEHDFVAFETMGVIGDSLASGASNYSGGVSDRPIYAWGKFIEREHGIGVTLFSYGGATTRSWLTNSRGVTALNNANALDCYLIGLGVNDAYSLGADYLGTISDIHVGSESENADTYYGNYSKIIGAIKAKSPRAKIFCLTNPKGTSEVDTAYNQAVKDIVLLYSNTYLIDLC